MSSFWNIFSYVLIQIKRFTAFITIEIQRILTKDLFKLPYLKSGTPEDFFFLVRLFC